MWEIKKKRDQLLIFALDYAHFMLQLTILSASLNRIYRN